MTSPFIHEALLQESLNGKVRCFNCERHCVIIAGGKGWCRTRRNRAGTLFTTTYGSVSSLSVNPIEKKPFYHFHPGSSALTAGSWSCNFGCPWCQNWDISKKTPHLMEYTSPRDFVDAALQAGCAGTSISFNEPTLSLEWSLDVFRLARASGLYNTFVTNGYMTPQALTMLVDAGLDAMNVDIKGDFATVKRYCQAIDVEKVWNICRLARQLDLHLEITTLLIPGVNDAPGILQEIASRIASELGNEVPWHISAYKPAYLFKTPPTPPELLLKAHAIGIENSLRHVYLGNLPGNPYENTCCPNCGELLIHRFQFKARVFLQPDGRCWRCNEEIPGVW